MVAASRRALAFIGFLGSALAAQRASSQNEYVDFLIETEGPFLEYVYYTQDDHPHDLPKCRPYLGDNPNDVRIWVSERLGEGREMALQGAVYFIKNSLRDHVVQYAVDWTGPDELAAANIRDVEALRKLICNNVFAAKPEGYDSTMLVIGSFPDPDSGNHWGLGDAEVGIHGETRVFFIRLNGERLANADHGRDWLTGASYSPAFWGGVMGHEVLHTLGVRHSDVDRADLVYEYGRSLSRMELPAPVAERVFPRKRAGHRESFGHLGVCALGAAPRGPDLFIRGDVDGSGALEVADAMRLLWMLFGTEELEYANVPLCGHALDANADDRLDISDPLRILTQLFLDASMLPPPPYPAPGEDPTPGKYGGDCLYDFFGGGI